jgi:hypothetical protein
MQQRPALRAVAATDATRVVAAAATPLLAPHRTAAVVAICAPSAIAATVAFLVTGNAGAAALRITGGR